MNETAELSDIVLPACSFLEQTGIGGYPVGLMHGISYITVPETAITEFAPVVKKLTGK